MTKIPIRGDDEPSAGLDTVPIDDYFPEPQVGDVPFDPHKPLDEMAPHERTQAAAAFLQGMRPLLEHAVRNAALQQRLNQSERNELTGLESKTRFFEQLDEALKEAQENHTLVGVGLIDLENLHDINEVYLHSGGDRVLQAVGDWLKLMSYTDQPRKENDEKPKTNMVFHLGGDEFGVIMLDVEPEEDYNFANLNDLAIKTEKLLYEEAVLPAIEAMEKEKDLGPDYERPYTGVTIGIAVSRQESAPKSETPDGHTLYEAADEALFKRKQYKGATIDAYNRRGKRVVGDQNGFITMIVVLLVLLIAAIVLVYMRVAGASG